MSFAFERPIGAPADVAELEYIAALHQTDVLGGIRKDGSIQGTLLYYVLFVTISSLC